MSKDLVILLAKNNNKILSLSHTPKKKIVFLLEGCDFYGRLAVVIRVRVGVGDVTVVVVEGVRGWWWWMQKLEEGERGRLKLDFNKNLVSDIIQIGGIVI